MKKLVSVLLSLALFCGLLVFSASAEIQEKKLYLSPNQTQEPDSGAYFTQDGGYYVKGQLLSFLTGDEDLSTNGVTAFSNPIGNDACLWASYFKPLVAEGLLYLHYTIPEGDNGLYELNICYALGYNAANDLQQDIEPGEHVIDLTEFAPEGDPGSFCLYVIIRCRAGENAVINEFYLSNYGASGDEPFDTTEFPEETEEPVDPDAPAPEIAVDGKIHLSADINSKVFEGGVMYVPAGFKHDFFVSAEEDKSDEGITVICNGQDGHAIWADSKDVIAKYKYLHYVIRSDSGYAIRSFGIEYKPGWDIGAVTDFDFTPGEHVVDLTTMPGFEDDANPYFYMFLALTADTEVVIDQLYLTDVKPEEAPASSDAGTESAAPVTTDKTPATDAPTSTSPTTEPKGGDEKASSNTGLIIGIAAAAVVVVAAVVGIVLGTKKKK